MCCVCPGRPWCRLCRWMAAPAGAQLSRRPVRPSSRPGRSRPPAAGTRRIVRSLCVCSFRSGLLCRPSIFSFVRLVIAFVNWMRFMYASKRGGGGPVCAPYVLCYVSRSRGPGQTMTSLFLLVCAEYSGSFCPISATPAQPVDIG